MGTEAKSESKQAFSSLSQNSQRFEHTETTVTGAETSANEAADLKTGANDTTSEQASSVGGGPEPAQTSQTPPHPPQSPNDSQVLDSGSSLKESQQSAQQKT